MSSEGESHPPAMLPVARSREEAKRFYDTVSNFYDYLTGAFERGCAEMSLDHLAINDGETVLEIGFGTGHCLRRITEHVGEKGKACGIDISQGMLEVTKRRLDKAGLTGKTSLCCGDALRLPYHDDAFDAVFMSFTLELFDTPEIPKVLHEIKRVLKLGGRLGVGSMSKEGDRSILLRLYEWLHMKWPKYVDCRPIYVEQCLKDAGYEIKSKERTGFLGFPVEIIVASTRRT